MEALIGNSALLWLAAHIKCITAQQEVGFIELAPLALTEDGLIWNLVFFYVICKTAITLIILQWWKHV